MTLTFSSVLAVVMTYSFTSCKDQGQRPVGFEDGVGKNGRTYGQTDTQTEAIALPAASVRSVKYPDFCLQLNYVN